MTSSERKPALQIQNVTKTFGRKTAVDNVSFELYPGEVFGFLGPNGAGKTTIIKMVMGFFRPDEGTIIINGYNRKTHYEAAMSSILQPSSCIFVAQVLRRIWAPEISSGKPASPYKPLMLES